MITPFSLAPAASNRHTPYAPTHHGHAYMTVVVAKMPPVTSGKWLAIPGGAVIGFFCRRPAGLAEYRSKRIAAGEAKPLPGWAIALLVLGTVFLFFGVCCLIVTSDQPGNS
jgi:hypothetical protein